MSAPGGRPPRSRALRRLRLAVRLVAVTASLAFFAGFLVFVERLERAEPQAPRGADGIVALTGGADRIADAIDLLRAGGGHRLLISGVNPSVSALDLTRSLPEARRLLSCCIELGYAAGNTIGNARETAGWARRHHIRSLIVVTSDYHMPRALAEIGDAVPGVALTPFPVVADRGAGGVWGEPGRLRVVLAEYLKYLVVLARVHLYPAAPYGSDAEA